MPSPTTLLTVFMLLKSTLAVNLALHFHLIFSRFFHPVGLSGFRTKAGKPSPFKEIRARAPESQSIQRIAVRPFFRKNT
jgi:hypothetical protein